MGNDDGRYLDDLNIVFLDKNIIIVLNYFLYPYEFETNLSSSVCVGMCQIITFQIGNS